MWTLYVIMNSRRGADKTTHGTAVQTNGIIDVDPSANPSIVAVNYQGHTEQLKSQSGKTIRVNCNV